MEQEDSGRLNIKTLGGLSIELNGRPVTTFVSAKAEALLVYLACSPRQHPRETLAELLWDDRTQRQAMSNLRTILYSLRKEVGPFVMITRKTAAINLDSDLSVDALVLETAVPPGNIQSSADAKSLEEALTLYNGDFLAGFFLPEAPDFEGWTAAQRENSHRLFVDGSLKLGRFYLDKQKYPAAIVAASRLLQIDPLAEAGHQQLMEALARNNQRAEALTQYEKYCQILDEELGLEPEVQTTKLFDDIRNDRFSEEIAFFRQITPDEDQSPILPDFLTTAMQNSGKETPFIGRLQSLEFLDQQLEAVLNGQTRATFIVGEAGAGKTSLVKAFVRRSAELIPDLVVASGRNSTLSASSAAYLPFREILAMLTGDIEGPFNAGQITADLASRLWKQMPQTIETLVQQAPNLAATFLKSQPLLSRLRTGYPENSPWYVRLAKDLETVMALSGEADSGILLEEFTNLVRNCARNQPLLIILEDLHWADSVSLNLLFHMGQSLSASPVYFLTTYRPEEVQTSGSARHPLEKVTAEFKRTFGEIEVNLDQVRLEEGRQFVDLLLDAEPNQLDEGFRQALFSHTGGHPLFTVELLETLKSRGDLRLDQDSRWTAGGSIEWNQLPSRIEGVFEEQIGRLEPSLAELLSVASVEGETFTAQVIAQVLNLDERQVIRQLSSELERQHKLIASQGIQRIGRHRLANFRFHHHLFQQYLYQNLAGIERTLWHEDVGNTLETIYQEDTDPIIDQLAHHFYEADFRNKAIKYLLKAGDQAHALYAHETAASHYEKAAGLQKELNQTEAASRTLMKLGLTYHLGFNYRQSSRSFNEAFSLQRTASYHQNEPLPLPPHALRLAWSDEPETIDPTRAHSARSGRLISQLFTPLVTVRRKLEIVPEAASRWEIDDAGRLYTFHLRPDAFWSDGQPVTANDFVLFLIRILNPQNPIEAPHQWYSIKGAERYHTSQSSQKNLGIHAPNPHKLQIELDQPAGHFLRILRTFYPLPSHTIKKYKEKWTDPDHLVTNGPFLLKGWEKNRHLTLIRNHHSSGHFKGNVQQVDITIAPFEIHTEMYQQDEIDMNANVYDPDTLRRLIQKHPEQYNSRPAGVSYGIIFDLSRPPFDDVRVRQAFAMAIDREMLAGTYLDGLSIPATGGLVPPGMVGHSSDIGLPYDPQSAKSLLASAGFHEKHPFPKIPAIAFGSKLYYAFDRIRQFIISQLHENLGIEINFQPSGWGDDVFREGVQVCLSGWASSLDDDPSYFLETATKGWKFHNQVKGFDQALFRATSATDQSHRLQHLREADRILIKEAMFVPLNYARSHMFIKPWIQNYFPTHDWKDVIINPH